MTTTLDEIIGLALAERGMSCIEHLGSGVFGDAFLVRTSAGQLRVVKRSKEGCSSAYSVSEAANMRALTSDHVVHIHGAWCSEHDAHFYLELEYCNGGDLEQYLSTHFPLTIPQLLSIATQIIVGLDHIHVRHMIHRDLKLENVFLHYGEGPEPIVKIGDFGLSKHMSSTDAKAQTRLGTPLYLAPELLNGHSYTRRADLWALGVLLHKLMTDRTPFDGLTLQEVAKSILSVKTKLTPEGTVRPAQLCDITNALLSRHRQSRPSTRAILQASDFTGALCSPPWLPSAFHQTVALFACYPHGDILVRADPLFSAELVPHVVHYGDQVRAQRRVCRSADGELWLQLVHPLCGFCQLGCGEYQYFQSLQDPHRHAMPESPPATGESERCSLTPTRISMDMYVPEEVSVLSQTSDFSTAL